MKKLYLLLGCVLLMSTVYMAVPIYATPPTVSGITTWTLDAERSDDFEGAEIDTNKWGDRIWYDAAYQSWFSSDNREVKDGKLHLTFKREPKQVGGHTETGEGNFLFNYSAGLAVSKFTIPGQASYLEVRAKLAKTDINAVSTIWLQSNPFEMDSNPNSEIDIQEADRHSNRQRMNLHTWAIDLDKYGDPTYKHVEVGRDGNQYTKTHDGKSLDGQFHDYGFMRVNDSVRFYLDGEFLWEFSGTSNAKGEWGDTFWEDEKNLILNFESHNGEINENLFPAVFEIDYVHTYLGDVPMIQLDNRGTLILSSVDARKGVPLAPHTVTVTNIGVVPVAGLSVALSGDDADKFIVTQPAETGLAAKEATTFELSSVSDLSVGTYNVTVTVTDNGNALKRTNVKFVVTTVESTLVKDGSKILGTVTIDSGVIASRLVAKAVRYNSSDEVIEEKIYRINVLANRNNAVYDRIKMNHIEGTKVKLFVYERSDLETPICEVREVL